LEVIVSFTMERAHDATDDSDDEMLTFTSQSELQTYMLNRLIELGFDTAVSNALRDMFRTLEEQKSLSFVCLSQLNACSAVNQFIDSNALCVDYCRMSDD